MRFSRLGNEVVIGVADDLHVRELTQGKVTTDIDPAIDVGCVRLATGDQEPALKVSGVLSPGTNQAVPRS